MRLVTADEMQEIDRRTIGGGLSSLHLMERAGISAASEAAVLLGSIPGRHVAILCGKGNNGGDGLVVARLLAERGAHVCVYLTHPPEQLSPDASHNYDLLIGTTVEIRTIPTSLTDPGPLDDPRQRPRSKVGDAIEPADLEAALASADLCIDAILGTGIGGDLEGRTAALVNVLNRASRLNLAVDIPTGVDGNSGQVRGTAVWADATVTFGLPKLGLTLCPGRERTGRLVVADIGFPQSVVESVAPRRYWVDRARARSLLPRLEPTAHKYERGCVLVIAGSVAYPGAAALAAEAALRAGAGIVHLVVPQPIRDLLEAKLTEVIVHGVPVTSEGTSGPATEHVAEKLLERANALAIGSGLGARGTHAWVSRLLGKVTCPAVVDADALEALPTPPHPGARLATPHAGELARWLGKPGAEVSANRLEMAAIAAAQFGVTLVMKGAPTFVASPDGKLSVNGSGNPGLATAGSGDVLSGILAALLAQGMQAGDAAELGVFLHGHAGDIAARTLSQRGLLAGDILRHLGPAYLDLES